MVLLYENIMPPTAETIRKVVETTTQPSTGRGR